MPRLIILVLVSAAIAVLAFGNSTPVSLVILGSTRTPEIPFGLLLAAAIGVGALLTLFLYGLVSLHRTPESKYKPIGRRVPYPETSGSSDLPSTPPPYATVGAGSPAYSTAPRSTAFVNESDQDIQDSAVYTPPASMPPTSAENVSSSSTEANNVRSDSAQSSAAAVQEPLVSAGSNYSGTSYPEAATDQSKSAAEPLFKIARPFVDKLTDKSAKKKQ